MTNGEIFHAIERCLDSATPYQVLNEFAAVCHAKAEHVAANWQDISLAEMWTRLARRVEIVANSFLGKFE